MSKSDIANKAVNKKNADSRYNMANRTLEEMKRDVEKANKRNNNKNQEESGYSIRELLKEKGLDKIA